MREEFFRRKIYLRAKNATRLRRLEGHRKLVNPGDEPVLGNKHLGVFLNELLN